MRIFGRDLPVRAFLSIVVMAFLPNRPQKVPIALEASATGKAARFRFRGGGLRLGVNWKASRLMVKPSGWGRVFHSRHCACPKFTQKVSSRGLDPTRAYFWPAVNKGLTRVVLDLASRDFFDQPRQKFKKWAFLRKKFQTHKWLTRPGSNYFGPDPSLVFYLIVIIFTILNVHGLLKPKANLMTWPGAWGQSE